MTPAQATEAFIAKVDMSGPCWTWTAAKNSKGYGCFGRHLAHRWAYEQWVGPIPLFMTIDHLCCNKLCVRPTHLEVVTLAENNRRKAERQTHCKRGHELSGPNCLVTERQRKCRACQHDVYDAGRVR